MITWNEAERKSRETELTALETFIYDNEPGDNPDHFRATLQAVLDECRASTGLTSKNNIEITEGAVVNGNSPGNFYIERHNGGLHMVNMKYIGREGNDFVGSPCCDPQAAGWLRESNVIGRI